MESARSPVSSPYLNAAITQLKAQGYPVREEDAARLSPFVRKHLGVYLDKLQTCYVARPASFAAPASVGDATAPAAAAR